MMASAYENGVKLAVDQICELETRLERSTAFKWWDITICILRNAPPLIGHAFNRYIPYAYCNIGLIASVCTKSR